MTEDWLTLLGVVLGFPISITIVLLTIVLISVLGNYLWYK